ncbi:Z1 domain-containing protein [Actinoplanes sp. NPDC048791]|uniref:Z1 domain-containing protein n=1 Tax=Actinoplanes sp. NPDC048791 TaxID=3154623 RepID=UPI0033D7343A
MPAITDWESDFTAAVAGLQSKGPAPLLRRINIDRPDHDLVAADDLQKLLEAHNQQDNHAVRQLALALADWDFEDKPAWDAPASPTDPRTQQRRQRAYELLQLPAEATARLDEIAPVATMRTTVISTMWEPWYTEKRRDQWALYWPDYRDYLLDKQGWPAESVAALDQATTNVVQRISDPTSDHQYQSKGLVVGYVQSGKTANFTGVIAKAIDAGYRLVIVMTGTIELLRSQTQRRLDRELVGRENLTRSLVDGEAAAEFDYATDEDWLADAFIRHGEHFIAKGFPGIERLTLLNDDYKRLKQGLTSLKVHLSDPSKPFYDPANLKSADVRLVVVKKNAAVLRKLAQDLKPLKNVLGDIPALIIDDESDLASINTKNPEKSKDRTAINAAITDLLGQLPRAQLIMYTATPFANFFVDPDDAGDIFPKNFIIALDRPPNYMGVQDFHDTSWDSDVAKTDPAASNEAAYIRRVGPPPEADKPEQHAQRETEVRLALDSFVLAGAIKVFREKAGAGSYRHHTMMVHEAVRNDKQSEMADLVRKVWTDNTYGEASSLGRLRTLWETDYRPVCAARADGYPVPETFEQLIELIGEATTRIKQDGDPVLIVNSDAAVQQHQQALDFDRNRVWRILIGGAKLSRGFTVEGLTVSFYTRKALQGDTLMQAGRWFGFRQGYRDLVRLFIRRDPDLDPRRVDLYEAFEGLMRDEVAFRDRLRDYEGFQDDGTPTLEPWQVPPIVSQHLPYLRPAGRSKMFNAVVNTMGDSGKLKDYLGLPPRKDSKAKTANYYSMLPVLAAAKEEKVFTSTRAKPEEPIRQFKAKVGIIAAADFVHILGNLRWHEDFKKVIEPVERFYRQLVEEGRLNDIAVIWPLPTTATLLTLPGLDESPIIGRGRRPDPRIDFSGSDPKHRDALERIAGKATPSPDAVADKLRDPQGRRATLLVSVAADVASAGESKCTPGDLGASPDPGDLAVFLSLAAPATATPHGRSVIEWTVKRSGSAGEATVPTAHK